MKYLKVKIVDHSQTDADKWLRRFEKINEITEKHAGENVSDDPGVHIDFELVRRPHQGIEWQEPYTRKSNRDSDRTITIVQPDWSWYQLNFSRHATEYDWVVANYSDDQFESGLDEQDLGGTSLGNEFGVSEILMRATDGQSGKVGPYEEDIDEWIQRFLHEGSHSMFDHTMDKPEADTTHFWHYTNDNLLGAIKFWDVRHSKGNMERGIFEIINRPLPLNQSWEGYDPEAIVFHTLLGSIEGSYAWLDTIDLSYHDAIGKDGRIYRMVPPGRSAWHAGRVSEPTSRAKKFFKGKNPNRKSHGVAFERNGEKELTRWQVLAGQWLEKKLEKDNDRKYGAANTFAHVEITSYKPEEVLKYRKQVMDIKAGEKEPEDISPADYKALGSLQGPLRWLMENLHRFTFNK